MRLVNNIGGEVMDKKFELFGDVETKFGVDVQRVRALRDFGDVKKGDVGGFVEKESNLSHDGDAWVCGNAEVFGNAKVSGDAKAYGNARVCGNARVYGDARVNK